LQAQQPSYTSLYRSQAPLFIFICPNPSKGKEKQPSTAIFPCAKAEVNRVLNSCFVTFFSDQTDIHFRSQKCFQSSFYRLVKSTASQFFVFTAIFSPKNHFTLAGQLLQSISRDDWIAPVLY